MEKEIHQCEVWEVQNDNHLRLIRGRYPMSPPLIPGGVISIYKIKNLADKLPEHVMHDIRALNKYLKGKFIEVQVSDGDGFKDNPFSGTITGEIMDQKKKTK